MSLNRKKLGDLGERLVAKHLQKLGYKIREMNFRCSIGEIDIVAQKDDVLILVEVRTRSSFSFGTPEESITRSKKERLINLAETYIQSHENLPDSWRIDVAAVEMRAGREAKIKLIENAVNKW